MLTDGQDLLRLRGPERRRQRVSLPGPAPCTMRLCRSATPIAEIDLTKLRRQEQSSACSCVLRSPRVEHRRPGALGALCRPGASSSSGRARCGRERSSLPTLRGPRRPARTASLRPRFQSGVPHRPSRAEVRAASTSGTAPPTRCKQPVEKSTHLHPAAMHALGIGDGGRRHRSQNRMSGRRRTLRLPAIVVLPCIRVDRPG